MREVVAIVGHGASLVGAGRGREIDQFPVVRLKRCHQLLGTTDYGSRVDYACATRKHIEQMTDMNAKEYWLYPKSEADLKAWGGSMAVRIGQCCWRWQEMFREFAKEGFNCAPHFTTGFAALIMALEWLSPAKVYLAGFDNLLNPGQPYRNVLKDWMVSTPHDLAVENRMLPMLMNHYQTEIVPL